MICDVIPAASALLEAPAGISLRTCSDDRRPARLWGH